LPGRPAPAADVPPCYRAPQAWDLALVGSTRRALAARDACFRCPRYAECLADSLREGTIYDQIRAGRVYSEKGVELTTAAEIAHALERTRHSGRKHAGTPLAPTVPAADESSSTTALAKSA
jgi:hypothetical protein